MPSRLLFIPRPFITGPIVGAPIITAVAVAGLAALMPQPGVAQTIGYGNPDAGSDASADAGGRERASARRGGQSGKRRVEITPYIEAQQIVSAELSPGNDVLTYSRLAAGVDASLQGRNNALAASVRYERTFGWGRARDSDGLSGLARGYLGVAPGIRIDAGAMASRTRIDSDGLSAQAIAGLEDTVTQVYSLYAGPSVTTKVGKVDVNAGYQIGYTEVGSLDSYVSAPGAVPADVFDHSVVHQANLRASVKPGEVLPVGIGAGATYYREDVSNLDQRVDDFRARVDVTVPITNTLAAVAGVGYENVEVSNRDAVRDARGSVVIGPDGRLVTDKSRPRQIGYDTSGFIWDAGVIWRPSRRTTLEAYLGRRYGSTSVNGRLSYQVDGRSSLQVSVYDNVAGIGGQMTRGLMGLSTDFQVIRDPLTGNANACVVALQGGNGCLDGVLGSLRSSTFRARGISASYNINLGKIEAGLGAGYDRRRYIGAPGTILAGSNGRVDQNYWLNAWLKGKLGEQSGYSATLLANWFETGSGLGGDQATIGANATYYRQLTGALTATAALGLYGTTRAAPLDDLWYGSALMGLRYSF